MADTLRLIKKYPNRRLYDTRNSCYITLADVKRLVITKESFQVVDAKSGDDLTRAILLQIILEEESGGTPMFTHEVLSEFIRFYGNAMQGFMGEYLQRNIQTFCEFQRSMQLADGDGQSCQPDPAAWAQFMNGQAPAMQSLMSSYLERSKLMLDEMQRQFQTESQKFFANLPFPAPEVQRPGAGDVAATTPSAQMPTEEGR